MDESHPWIGLAWRPKNDEMLLVFPILKPLVWICGKLNESRLISVLIRRKMIDEMSNLLLYNVVNYTELYRSVHSDQ
jgi:hypothetical protein